MAILQVEHEVLSPGVALVAVVASKRFQLQVNTVLVSDETLPGLEHFITLLAGILFGWELLAVWHV